MQVIGSSRGIGVLTLVMAASVPKPKPVKKTWITGYGIKGFPTVAKPPVGIRTPCTRLHPESGMPYWKHVLSNYKDAIYKAYKARGTAGAWACASLLLMRSCCKRTGSNAFAGQTRRCSGKKLVS